MPQHLRQGIFATAKRYPVIVRLSSHPGDLQSDRIPALYGMALKVLGVTGKKVLPNDEGHNQDFLLNNIPIIPFGHVAAYWALQQMAEKLAESSSTGQPAAEGASGAAPAMPYYHILGETFHTMAALRFGAYVAKLSAAPSPSRSDPLRGHPFRIQIRRCAILLSTSLGIIQQNTSCERSY